MSRTVVGSCILGPSLGHVHNIAIAGETHCIYKGTTKDVAPIYTWWNGDVCSSKCQYFVLNEEERKVKIMEEERALP